MVKPRKTKAPAIAVPQSDEAADAVLREYGETLRDVALLQTELDEGIAQLKADCEGRSKPLQDRLKQLFVSLQAFGAAHRDRLTDNGKTKTVKLGAGEFGWRFDPASVKFAKGLKNDDVVERIRAAVDQLVNSSDKAQRVRGALIEATFIRTKHEPNKDAMLARPEDVELIEGVSIKQGEEQFFIDPVGLELAEPK